MDEPKKENETIEKKDNLIDQANAAAARMEAANKVNAELLERQENLKAREIVGGQTVAGKEVKQQTADEKAIESARNMLKGTGYEDRLFPTKT